MIHTNTRVPRAMNFQLVATLELKIAMIYTGHWTGSGYVIRESSSEGLLRNKSGILSLQREVEGSVQKIGTSISANTDPPKGLSHSRHG
jgi:hypothetical protein